MMAPYDDDDDDQSEDDDGVVVVWRRKKKKKMRSSNSDGCRRWPHDWPSAREIWDRGCSIYPTLLHYVVGHPVVVVGKCLIRTNRHTQGIYSMWLLVECQE
jgi:hypothetical protein